MTNLDWGRAATIAVSTLNAMLIVALTRPPEAIGLHPVAFEWLGILAAGVAFITGVLAPSGLPLLKKTARTLSH